MERVSISRLKDQLSAYLKRVQAGETVLVMDRGKPVARLERVESGVDDDARYRRLLAAGLVRPPQKPFDADVVDPLDPGRDARIVEALLEEREKGW
jgi:prevent-host-death family protein